MPTLGTITEEDDLLQTVTIGKRRFPSRQHFILAGIKKTTSHYVGARRSLIDAVGVKLDGRRD